MINAVVLIQRIKEEQSKLALAAVQFPMADPAINGVNAGKWQGLNIALSLINEILTEDEELDK